MQDNYILIYRGQDRLIKVRSIDKKTLGPEMPRDTPEYQSYVDIAARTKAMTGEQRFTTIYVFEVNKKERSKPRGMSYICHTAGPAWTVFESDKETSSKNILNQVKAVIFEYEHGQLQHSTLQ